MIVVSFHSTAAKAAFIKRVCVSHAEIVGQSSTALKLDKSFKSYADNNPDLVFQVVEVAR